MRGFHARVGGIPDDAGARETDDPYEMSAGALDLDRLAADWQVALDAAAGALESSDRTLPTSECQLRRTRLALERRLAESALQGVARVDHIAPLPWIAPFAVTSRMLGLPSSITGCIFDLDGVLTDSGRAHATAWAEVLDSFLLWHAESAGWQFIPFDPDADYRAYFDGRTRLDGIHAFLASRGIHLPVGGRDDGADADTAFGLARRKSDALARVLQRRGVTPLPGARRYLEAVGHAGLGRAVVSSSQSTAAMLELAGLSRLIEVSVDAAAIRAGTLRSRPAPDILLAACRQMGVDPAHAVTFTHTPDGVVAGHAAGLLVVGVGGPITLDRLRGFGAEETAGSLTGLLDHRLAAY